MFLVKEVIFGSVLLACVSQYRMFKVKYSVRG